MLSILIPTYNRSEFLLKNLNVLHDIIKRSGFSDEITIIISNNGSPDNTQEMIESFSQTHDITIRAFEQKENLGVKANVLFLLAQSNDEYIMFMGDDDYISYDYLVECVDIIRKDKSTYVIIPNFIPVSVNDEVLGPPRDKLEEAQSFKPGFKTLMKNSFKGHQLSGLTLKRAGLREVYLKNKVDNLYQFIYFTSIWCLKGTVYCVSNPPVRVTQPVKKKDWSYGEDGAINEIFDNYKKLPVSYFKRFLLELYFMHINAIRLSMYKTLGTKVYLKAFYKITFAKNATILFSTIFPVYHVTRWMYNSLKRLVKA